MNYKRFNDVIWGIPFMVTFNNIIKGTKLLIIERSCLKQNAAVEVHHHWIITFG